MSKDIFPSLQIERHDGVFVVRDDLFPYGSKARFFDEYVANLKHKEMVYGSSPRWGYAQISLAYLAKRHGKKLTLFLAKSDTPHEYTQRAANLGAVIVEVSMGFLKVCESKARKYALEHNALVLPMGLNCPEAIEAIRKQASSLPIDPDEVWSVISSGTLSRGLQKAFPNADVYGVQVGKSVDAKSAGRAKIIECPLAFGKPVKIKPPFPSVPEYDAKAWQYIPKDGKRIRLFWNVGA